MSGALAWQVNYVNEKNIFWVLRGNRTGISRGSSSLVCADSSLSLSRAYYACLPTIACILRDCLLRSLLPNPCSSRSPKREMETRMKNSFLHRAKDLKADLTFTMLICWILKVFLDVRNVPVEYKRFGSILVPLNKVFRQMFKCEVRSS